MKIRKQACWLCLFLVLIAMPAWSKEIVKESTATTKEIVLDDATGIKLYGQASYGQYKMEDFNAFIDVLASMMRQASEGDVHIDIGSGSRLSDGFSYEGGLIFPLLPLLKLNWEPSTIKPSGILGMWF